MGEAEEIKSNQTSALVQRDPITGESPAFLCIMRYIGRLAAGSGGWARRAPGERSQRTYGRGHPPISDVSHADTNLPRACASKSLHFDNSAATPISASFRFASAPSPHLSCRACTPRPRESGWRRGSFTQTLTPPACGACGPSTGASRSLSGRGGSGRKRGGVDDRQGIGANATRLDPVICPLNEASTDADRWPRKAGGAAVGRRPLFRSSMAHGGAKYAYVLSGAQQSTTGAEAGAPPPPTAVVLMPSIDFRGIAGSFPHLGGGALSPSPPGRLSPQKKNKAAAPLCARNGQDPGGSETQQRGALLHDMAWRDMIPSEESMPAGRTPFPSRAGEEQGGRCFGWWYKTGPVRSGPLSALSLRGRERVGQYGKKKKYA